MTENKKVKNTRKGEYNGIQFRSNLEIVCYKKLIEAGFKPQYESVTFTLLDKFKLQKVLFYAPVKGGFKEYPRTIMSMTYTPDFYIEYKGYHILFDTKGQPNETYPLKKKWFLRQLEDTAIKTGKKFIFFEPHNQRQILESINIIKNL